MQWENNMSLGLGSLTSELDRKETAFQSLPQSELMKKRKLAPTGGLPASLTDALIAEKVLNDKAAAANSMAASMQGDPRTVVQQNEADIETQTQQEVLKATAGVLQNRANKIKSAQAKRAMQQGMGITRAPVQRRQVMAQGGIVGYDNGGFVDTLKDAGSYLTSGQGYLGGMSPLEAALTASMFIPGIGIAGGLTRAGYAGLKGLQAAKGTGMLTRGAQAAGRGLRKGVQSTYSVPKLSKKGVPLKSGARQFSPGRTAQTAGVAGVIGSKLLKPGDSTPVEETPDSIEAPVTQRSEAPTSTGGEKERDLSRLIYLLRGGTGREYDQQEFTNKIQQDTLIAKQELNKINSANVLQNRLTQVNAEIAALQAQLSDTPTNRELAKAEEELAKDRGDSAKQERVNLLRIASAAELERYADPMGSGDVGLLVQRKELQARVNQIQKSLTNDPMDAIVARNT
jgi:hypothetical protein